MDLKKSLYQTLAFFDLFDFPLTKEEIKAYLMNYQKPLHIKEVEGTLKELPGVESIKDYWVLSGRGHLAEVRKTRRFIAEKFWTRVRIYSQYLRHVPFVQMIAVCNNLAYDNASPESDIDLFIVLKKDRLWTARLIITAMLQFFGVRRHGDKIAGRFCLSFFVTPEAFDFSKLELKPEDPYLAYWLRTLAPILGKETFELFSKTNQGWLGEKYGLQFNREQKHLLLPSSTGLKRLLEKLLTGCFGNQIENLIQKLFKRRTLRKFKELGPEANVIMSETMLKFHNHDRRKEYAERWAKKVEELMALPGETT